jgi:predicted regulator of Ras-like GTPase activity (Roadblock/LC7/MglB family)
MVSQALAQSISQTLSALRDIQGVHGSFFVSGAGRLVSKDLPGVFDEALFAEVGPRIARLQETLTSAGDDVDMCLLRFAEYKLFLRPTVTGFLCVLMASSVNLPALKMAVSLAARRINAELAASPSSAPPDLASLPPQLHRGSVVK